MNEVHIVGIGMTRLGKHLQTSVKSLVREAVDRALADAGCEVGAVKAAWFCNTRQGIFEGQHGIRGQVALRPLGLEGIPIFNTDNACASSAAGLHLARSYILSGCAETALVVGAEKMNFPGRERDMYDAFNGSTDVELAAAHRQRVIDAASDFPGPVQEAPAAQSVFMQSYSAQARLHMKRYGTTQRQIAAVAQKNHWNSQFNPNAQYQVAMDIEAILADRLISWPLTRSMCAPMSDGACAILLCSDRALARFDQRRAIPIVASQVTTGVPHALDDARFAVGRIAADRAFQEAGLGPGEVDVAEVHDASAFGELKQIENLRFCDVGDSGAITERGETALSGRLPVNPSGGLLSKGHPIGATGAIQIHELVMQLRGEAGTRQVEGARIAVAENGGGAYDGEEAVACVTILKR